MAGTWCCISFTTWSWFQRGTEWDDSIGIRERSHDTLAPLVRRAEALGVVLVIENCEDIDPAERVALAASFDSPAVRVSLDTGHAHYAHGAHRAPPVDAFVRAAGAALAHVHLQDADGFGDRHWPIGQGSIAWPSVFAALGQLPQMPRLIMELATPAG
ncbi:MAG: TIM barrel protein [Paracoccaceae bacterium]